MKTRRAAERGVPRAALIIVLSLFLAAGAAAAGTESTWFLGGEVTGLGLAMDSQGLSGLGLPDGWTYGGSTTLSASLGVRGQRTRAEASFDVAALTGKSAALAMALAPVSGAPVAGDAESAVSARLRTLWARLDLDWASVEIGRQVVNYGRGALWSPVDLFALVDRSGVSPDRLGTDALRVKIPLGDLSGLDLVAAPNSDPGKGRYATRLSGDMQGFDGGLLGAWDGTSGRIVGAADFKFDLEAAFYGEAYWSRRIAGAAGDAADWLRAVGGFDWSTGDLVVAGEYYWNGGGAAADPSFPARHYLFASLSWASSEFLRLSVAGTIDLTGGAARLQAFIALDSSQNSSLLAFIDATRGSFAPVSTTGYVLTPGVSFSVKF
jgi:hypothetical protein